ncbi:MAG: DUF6484 domain-containing protein [Nitrospira sp.]
MAQEPNKDVIELLLATNMAPDPVAEGVAFPCITSLVMGVLVKIDTHGQGMVAFDTQSVDSPVVARTIVPVTDRDIGRQVCLMFEQGNSAKPVILGFLQLGADRASQDVGTKTLTQSHQLEAKVDGERIVLEGHKEIVLKCGKASITLTQDGRVLIRGTYLSSRSSGPNLIKGGSVQLN